MAMIPGTYDWQLRVGTQFVPSVILENMDISESEFVAHASDGNLAVWLGSAGRQQPDPAPPVVGALTMVTTGTDEYLVTEINGQSEDGATASIEPGSYAAAWYIWHTGQADPDCLLEGTLVVKGRQIP